MKKIMLLVLLSDVWSICPAQSGFRLTSQTHYNYIYAGYIDSASYRYAGSHGSIDMASCMAVGYDTMTSWSYIDDKYQLQRKEIQMYDSAMRPTSQINQIYEDSKWNNRNGLIIKYDDRGDTVSMIMTEVEIMTDTMEVKQATFFTYDSLGRRIKRLDAKKYGDTALSIWTYDTASLLIHIFFNHEMNGIRTEVKDISYEYSPSHKLLKKKIFTAYSLTDPWTTTSLDTFVYDHSDSLVSRTGMYAHTKDPLKAVIQERYRYDTLHHSIVHEECSRDTLPFDWLIYSTDSTVYDPRYHVISKHFCYHETTERNLILKYTYNEAGQCILKNGYELKNGCWVPYLKQIYTYDTHGLLTSVVDNYRDAEAKELRVENAIYYYYEAIP